jgi:hypothetical protein
MKSIVALTGIVLVGVGVATLVFDWKIGLCAGTILLGLGLFIDAMRK